jgi:hypothetical protein
MIQKVARRQQQNYKFHGLAQSKQEKNYLDHQQAKN